MITVAFYLNILKILYLEKILVYINMQSLNPFGQNYTTLYIRGRTIIYSYYYSFYHTFIHHIQLDLLIYSLILLF